MRFSIKSLALGVALAGSTLLGSMTAQAGSILPGFNGSTLGRNDDSSTGAVGIGFGFNFFGTTYTSLFVNNNGNVTFNTALNTFTPFGLTGGVSQPIIAPFFADVDTRNAASAQVTYGTGTFNGRAAFGVNWDNVGYYSQRADKLNSFQMLLINRTDVSAGSADILFNYNSIKWEAGEASGGTNGLGGNSARAGYSNGAGSFFELAGSGVNGAFLDGGRNALASGSNIGVAGQYVFEVRNGVVTAPTPVPEPATLALFGLGLAALGVVRRRRA